MAKTKTGSVFFRDEEGNLFEATSYVDTVTKEVTTENTPVAEDEQL